MNLSRKVLCLDWDRRSLRIVAARIGGGRTVLEDAHSHRLPNTVDADDPQSLGDFIRQMLRRHRLSHKRVVVDVPRERAVINRLALPPTPIEEVAAAVRFQAMKELPFPLESAAIDYVVMERDEHGLATEVLLAAVTKETLEKVRATCEAAGLTPVRIGLRPYANLVSVQSVQEAGERRILFVDIGPGATEIDVMHGQTLGFARSANVNVPVPVSEGGGREDSRMISIADVADLDASDEAIEAAGDELMVEVTRTLQAYRATESDTAIDVVLVAGGTGIESQLADRLHERMGYPVELFDPTTALGVDPAEAPKLRSFAAALGLAWGIGREGALALDFLNPKRPVSSREVLRRRVRVGVFSGAAVLALAAAGYIWHYTNQANLRDELKAANSKLWEEVREKNQVLNIVEEAREWAVEAIWPEDLLAITRLAIEPGERMVVREIELETISRNPSITLRNVHVSDWQVPTEFVRALTEFGGEEDRIYEVSQGQWKPVPHGKKFKGSTDVTIDLLVLRDYREKAAERAKLRKQRLQKPRPR